MFFFSCLARGLIIRHCVCFVYNFFTSIHYCYNSRGAINKEFSMQPASQWPWKAIAAELSTLPEPLLTMSFLSNPSHHSRVWTLPWEHFISMKQNRRVLRMISVASAVNCHLIGTFLKNYKYLVICSTQECQDSFWESHIHTLKYYLQSTYAYM